MAINMESKDFVDSAIELVALKSKILLTENNIIELSKKHKSLSGITEYIKTENRWIRIYPDEKEDREKGPPLILVQCKRYKKENLVDINTVKAFYSDLIFEKSPIGLIATTSRIAPGGREAINARGYNIMVAESNEVNKMINNMWRQAYN